MSTILKALQQLESDEERADPASPSNATSGEPMGDPEMALPALRKRRRRSPFGRGVALAVVLAIGFMVLAWLGLRSRLEPVEPAAEAEEIASVVESPSSAPAPPVSITPKRQATPPAEVVGDAIAAAAPAASPTRHSAPVTRPSTAEPVAPPPAPEQLAPAREASPVEVAPAPTVVAAAPPPAPQRPAPESQRPVALQEVPASVPEPPAAEVSRASASPTPAVRAVAATSGDEPERAAPAPPKPEPAVVTPSAPRRAESVVDIALAGEEPPARLRPVAPAWTLERTRWHPAPEKRAASLRIDGLDQVVREGDDVGGYRVSEIKPSSIILEREGEEIVMGVGGR
jgi:hypothetical protein